MAEVLSQEEIDALLNSVSTTKSVDEDDGDAQETVYLYDFKHPSRVSKDQLRSLRTIHESFARILGTYLTTLLRTMVDVQLLSIDQVTFLEFTMAMSNPGCIWIFNLDELDGKGIIEVSPDLVVLTIERLFGGEGKHSGESRSLSVIEQNVAGKIIEKVMGIYDEAWSKAVQIKSNIVSFEMNPQFAQVAPSSETAVVMFLEINVRNTTFPMNICFPYFVLDPLIQKLSSENFENIHVTEKTTTDQLNLEENLKNTKVQLKTFLGKTTITLQELLDLENNDVLILNKRVDEQLHLSIENKMRFLGTPGVSGKKKAVRIDRHLTEEEILKLEHGLNF